MYATPQQGEDISLKGHPWDMHVLVANDPLAYREVISAAIKELRPHITVYTAAPVDLDNAFLRLTPGLVLCSRITALIEKEASAWIELYPEHTSGAIVSLAGKKSTYNTLSFDVLLSVLDDAYRLFESI